MSRDLSTLPTDIIRGIFGLLDDTSLYVLLRVCRVTRVLSLVTLLTRHKLYASNSTEVSFSSDRIEDLEDNILRVTKFTFRHNNAPSITLAYICISLPSVVELELNIYFPLPTGRRKQMNNRLIRLVCALLERNDGIPNLFILTNGVWGTSGRRRELKSELTRFIPPRVLRLTWPVVFPVLFIATGAEHICKSLLDPFTLRGQWNRLRRDLELLISERLASLSAHSPQILQLRLRPLSPSAFPSWIHENWNLMVFNEDKTTQLQLGHGLSSLPVKKNYRLALPSIHLPMLKTLRICERNNLSLADITSFLVRHPTIKHLSLDHHSLSATQLISGIQWQTPNLTALEIPLHYLEAILCDINIRHLSTICIGKRPRRRVGIIEKILHPGRRTNFIEKNFDFNVLDRVLDILTGSAITSLMMVLPGGLKSQPWLTRITSLDRPEKRMTTVRNITIFTENDRDFHLDVIPSLQKWLGLFNSVRRFRCMVPKNWTAGLTGTTPSGVTFQYAHNGKRESFTEDIPWGNCHICGE